jgi:hypothetical protein
MIWRWVMRGVVCGVLLLGVVTTTIMAQTKSEGLLAIDHKVFSHPQRRSYPLAIDAMITSPAGIRKAEVFCRPVGARQFTALPMVQRGENVYRAVVPDWMTTGPGLEYYITATDQLGGSTSHGFVGFPLVVRLVSTQRPTQEERLKTLQGTLDIIRKSRESQQGVDEYGNVIDPLQNRDR